MRILFLGDVVGSSGCSKLMNNLLEQIKIHKIDFVIVNAENAAEGSRDAHEDIHRCGCCGQFLEEECFGCEIENCYRNSIEN